MPSYPFALSAIPSDGGISPAPGNKGFDTGEPCLRHRRRLCFPVPEKAEVYILRRNVKISHYSTA